MRAQLGLVAALLLAVSTAQGQELRSLNELLSRPPDQISPSYPFIRCSALYGAISQRMGTDRMGPDMTRQVEASFRVLATAALALQNTSKDLNEAASSLKREQDAIIEVYKARMDRNYTASGQAFMDDKLMTGDLTLCKSITQMADGKFGKQ